MENLWRNILKEGYVCDEGKFKWHQKMAKKSLISFKTIKCKECFFYIKFFSENFESKFKENATMMLNMISDKISDKIPRKTSKNI